MSKLTSMINISKEMEKKLTSVGRMQFIIIACILEM